APANTVANGSGQFTFSTITVTSNDIVEVFIVDATPSNRGVTISNYGSLSSFGPNYTGNLALNVTRSAVTFRGETGSITNGNIGDAVNLPPAVPGGDATFTTNVSPLLTGPPSGTTGTVTIGAISPGVPYELV